MLRLPSSCAAHDTRHCWLYADAVVSLHESVLGPRHRMQQRKAVPGPTLPAHRPCALGLDGDPGNVAEGRLREGDWCRAPGGDFRDCEGVGRASACQLAGQQAPRQVVDDIQYTACQTCSTHVQLL